MEFLPLYPLSSQERTSSILGQVLKTTWWLVYQKARVHGENNSGELLLGSYYFMDTVTVALHVLSHTSVSIYLH